MIAPILYQPINFIPTTDCSDSGGGGCSDENNPECGGAATVANYSQVALSADQLQFQFNITPCEDAAQLLANNDFETDLTDWSQLSSNVSVIDGKAVFGGSDTLYQAVGLTINKEYLIQIEVTEVVDGDLLVSLGANSNSNYTIDTAGTYSFYLTASNATNFALIYEGSGCSIQFVNLFENVTTSDFIVEFVDSTGAVVAETDASNHYVLGNIAQVSFVWENVIGLDLNPLPYGIYTLNVVQDCGLDGYEMESNAFDYGAHSGVCTIQFQGCMDSRYAFNMDFFDFSPMVRVVAVKGYAKHQWDRLLWRNSAGYQTNYYSRGEKLEEVRIEMIPEYLLDFFASLAGYNNVYLNGVLYNVAQDSIDPLYDDDTPNRGSLVLEVTKRQQTLTQVKCTAVQKDCTPTPNCWAWLDSAEIDWLDDECIELIN